MPTNDITNFWMTTVPDSANALGATVTKVKHSARTIRSFLFCVGAAILAALLSLLLDPLDRSFAANLAAFLGILCLAAPTIGLNEQGRMIWRVKSLVLSGETYEKELSERKDLDEKGRKDLELSNAQAKERLRAAERELAESKGSWTPLKHHLLYIGYGMVFASAMSRLF